MLLTAILLTWTSARGETPRPTVEQLVHYFDDVVFGAEMGPHLASPVIAKWQGKVTIKLAGRVNKSLVDLVVPHVRTLADLTRIQFRVVAGKGKGPAEIDVLFVKRSEMAKVKVPGVEPALIRRLASSGGCYFLSFKKPPSRIVKGVIVANIERTRDALNHCLLEELTQAMGLPNDSDALRPSLFSDRDRLVAMSRADRILVRALYDVRLRPGMNRQEALDTARSVIADHNARLP